MLSVLNSADSIEAAYNILAEEYDVDRNLLREDLLQLVENLVKQGIIQVSHGSSRMDDGSGV